MNGLARPAAQSAPTNATRRSPAGRHRRVVILAICALAALVLVRPPGTAARAAVPAPGQTLTGRATFYSLGDSGQGNCSFPPEVIADRMYVAAGPEDYADAGGCGSYLDVTGPTGNARVIIADKCPECEPGHLDMSPESFAAIGPLSSGVIPISYQAVRDPALPGPLAIRVKEGSSQWWIGFLVMNHGNPLASVEYGDASGNWHQLVRQTYNYWLKQDGAGAGPFTLRITDVYGHQIVVDDVALTPSVTQNTGAWMYGSGTGSPTASVTPSPSSSGPSPTSSTSTTNSTNTTNSTSATRTTSTTSATSSTSATGTGSGASGGTSAPAGSTTCTAAVQITTSWPGGYQALATVHNTGARLNPWLVTWTLPAGATVTAGWNAAVTQAGQQVSAAAPSWNPSLATGDSVSIGFNVSGSSNPPPGDVRLGGTACQG